MRLVRWLGRILLALVTLGVVVVAVARCHDGPLGPVPGSSGSARW